MENPFFAFCNIHQTKKVWAKTVWDYSSQSIWIDWEYELISFLCTYYFLTVDKVAFFIHKLFLKMLFFFKQFFFHPLHAVVVVGMEAKRKIVLRLERINSNINKRQTNNLDYTATAYTKCIQDSV